MQDKSKKWLLGILAVVLLIVVVMIYLRGVNGSWAEGYEAGVYDQLDLNLKNCIYYQCYSLEQDCGYLYQIDELVDLSQEHGIAEDSAAYKNLGSEERTNLLISKDICFSTLSNDSSYYDSWKEFLGATKT